MPGVRIGHVLLHAALCFILIKQNAGLKEVKMWSKRLAFFFIGFIFTHIWYFTLIRFPFFSTEWDYTVSLSMSAFIFLVAAYGYIQPEVFQGTQGTALSS
jgi:putative effector of murein hydrolase LrgA (UPF0299 family)